MWTLFVYLSPILLLIGVYGVVVVVALYKAAPEDVPKVLREANTLFRGLTRGQARNPRQLPQQPGDKEGPGQDNEEFHA